MTRLLRLASWTALLIGLCLRIGAAPIPFAQSGTDLAPDPALLFGTLPNGVRYVVMPNHEPKDRVSLRLLVLAGSLQENESQQGLAHFLEHMAFNGSTHYAPGTLVERLQRLGMEFGADTNAATDFDHTIYQLELPDTKAPTLDEGIQILADYAGGLLLKPEMIEKERGIILSEKRTRDSVAYRTFVDSLQFLEGKTRLASRLPIGKEDIIRGAGRGPFADFYNTWYRPELMVVIAVGDADPQAMQRRITDAFSGLAARAPEPAPVDMGVVEPSDTLRAHFHAEPEAPTTRVVLAAVSPHRRDLDSAAHRIKELARNLAIDMVNRRFAVLAKDEKAQFTRAQASIDDLYDISREARIDVVCKPEQWAAAVGVAEQELRKALVYGFRPDELAVAAADLRNDLEQAEKSASTRRSEELAGEIAESLVDKEVFTSPKDDLALLGPALGRITTGECLGELREAWKSNGRYLFVSGNAAIAGDADAAVAAAYRQSAGYRVVPNLLEKKVSWGYTDFGKPGAVATRTHVDDLDLTEVTFANGVRLNVKKTPFESDTVHLEARLGLGQLSEPPGKPGLSTFTSLTYSAGGLGKHSVEDLKRILAGHNVGLSFTSTLDAFSLSGETNREDLLLEFQLLAASLTDPGYRPEAQREAKKRIEAAYIQFAHTAGGPIALHVNRILAGGDPRFGLPSQQEMLGRTLAEERDWLAPVLASGTIEVTVVGDADVETVIAAAAKTLGTLPARAPRGDDSALRRVAFPSEPFSDDFGFDTKIQKSLVGVYWPTPDGMDIRRQRSLNMLRSVLEDRLRVRVREQLGDTYAPTVGCTASDILPGYGYLAAIIIVEPEKAKFIQQTVVDVAADISAHGVTADELARAKNPALTAIAQTERTNGYWLGALARAQERPEVLDWARTRRADFEAITKETLDALAKPYLGANLASRVLIHPYATPAPMLAPTAEPTRSVPPRDGL